MEVSKHSPYSRFLAEFPNQSSCQRIMSHETLGKYSLDKLVATGGMAEIWLARDRDDNFVAIKRILPHLARDERFTTMFLDEAALASKLLHPNIARIFELGHEGDEYFLAMEFIDGADLADVLDAAEISRTLIPIAAAAFITCEVLDALHFAHTFHDGEQHLGIVHRDVSPHNVLISTDGRVKLVDFGVAKAVERHSKTQTGVIKGKLSYMAPEQVRQDPMDARADLFAVGVLFYELLTNQTPFGRDLTAVSAILNDAPVDPRELRPTIPDAVAEIVLKALEKDPDHRFQSSGEMRNVLRVWLGEQPDVTPDDIARLTEEFNANTRPALTETVKIVVPVEIEPKLREAEAPLRTIRDTSSIRKLEPDESVRTATPMLGLLLGVTMVVAGMYFFADENTPPPVHASNNGFVFVEEEIEEWEVSDSEMNLVRDAQTHYHSSDLLVSPWVERLELPPARLDPGAPDILDHLDLDTQAAVASEPTKRVKKTPRKKKRKKVVKRKPIQPTAEKKPHDPKPQKSESTLERLDKAIPSF